VKKKKTAHLMYYGNNCICLGQKKNCLFTLKKKWKLLQFHKGFSSGFL